MVDFASEATLQCPRHQRAGQDHSDGLPKEVDRPGVPEARNPVFYPWKKPCGGLGAGGCGA
jgi:hypothetical protein